MNFLKKYWKSLGPGLVTGAADDDPSGIATYSQMGARNGFGLLWLTLITYPLMSVVQEMCARIGLVTGTGLAANIKRHYSRKILFFCTGLLFLANVFNIGANLGAMAEASRLIVPQINFTLLVIFFAVLSLVLQIFVSYKTYAKYLKFLTLALFAYIISALMVDLNWGEAIFHTFVPQINFTKDELILICAAFGTTISPYLFFWQTSQEVEEGILRGESTEELRRSKNSPEEIKKMRVDVWSGMFLSNIVMYFIIAACAATLFENGVTDIGTAAQAASALRPFAGDLSYLLFAFGIIGTGLLAVPVLAGSASYAVSESFGWQEGLYHKFKEAVSFYAIIILSMILGILLNLFGINPIKALIYSAVLNGLIAPVILFFIVRISSSGEVMGTYRNGGLSKTIGWATVAIMALAGIAALAALLL